MDKPWWPLTFNFPRGVNSLLPRENLLALTLGAVLVGTLFALSRSGADLKGGNAERLDLRTKSAPGQQTASFQEARFNFGTALQQETIRHSFKLLNNSTNPIHVVGIQSSCSCTVPEGSLSELRIPPNGSLPIPVEYHSGTARGNVSSKVDVYLQGASKRYVVSAFLEGRITADFEIEPPSLDFGNLKMGQRASKRVRVLRGAGKGITMAEPKVSGTCFEISAATNQAALSSSEIGEIVVGCAAPLAGSSRTFNGMVEFATSSTRVPVARIPLTVTVAPEVEAIPDRIILSRADKQASETPETRITVKTLQPSRLLGAKVVSGKSSQRLRLAEIRELPEDSDRGLKHVARISKSLLSDRTRIDFELEVRTGTGQNEARFVSVQVSSLE